MQPASPLARNAVQTGCLVAFCMPFLFFGLFALSGAAYKLWKGGPLMESTMLLLFGLVFAGVALTLLITVIKGSRAQTAAERLRQREPDRPWLWRKEWADGVLLDRARSTGWVLLAFGTFWSLVSLPAALVVPQQVGKDHWKTLIAALFPLVGILILIAAAYHLVQRKRYGVSRCRIENIPIVPGRAFSGSIEAKIFEAPPDGFVMKLDCVRRVTTGSGKSRSTSERVLWQEEQTIAGARGMPSPNGMRIPFSFTLPRDVEPCDERDTNNCVVWRLYVNAEVPGVDYAATFELPVFRTGTFDSDFRSEEPSGPERHVSTAHDAAMAVATPSAKSRIAISRLPNGGEEIRVGLHGRFVEVSLFVLFAAIWWTAIVFMVLKRAPVCFPIVFILFGIVIVAGGVDMYLGRSHVQAERRGLTVRRTWLGIGRPVFYPREDIESIASAISTSSGSGGSAGKVYYAISASLRGGKKGAVARYIREKRDAEIVAARVARALGL